MMKSLPILFVIGLFVLPSGRALKCYQCASALDGDCASPSEDKIRECPPIPSTSTTSTTTTTTTTTTPPDGSGAGGDGSGAGGEGSGAGGVEGQIVYDGEGIQVVSGDEGDEDEEAGGNGGSNVVPAKKRVTRALVHHFWSKQVYADGQPKAVCVKKTTDTTVTRGCALSTDDCPGDCHKCDTDSCNSATSVALYTSMMFGLLAVVFMTR